MKVYILVDAEGITGVVNHDMQVKPDSPRYEETRRFIMSDLNAAIEGALEGGAAEIVVYDMHYYETNAMIDELHPKARAILGKPPKIDPPAGIVGSVSALFMPLSETSSLIKNKARSALKRLKDFTPYRIKPPYTIELEFYAEPSAAKAEAFEGIVRKGNRVIEMKGPELAPLWEGFLSRYTAG